jgi:hypothetical protein
VAPDSAGAGPLVWEFASRKGRRGGRRRAGEAR